MVTSRTTRNKKWIDILSTNLAILSSHLLCFFTVKTIVKLNPENSDKFETKTQKISRRGPHSPGNTKFGHFTFLFNRGRQRNLPRIIMHVHSYCISHNNFFVPRRCRCHRCFLNHSNNLSTTAIFPVAEKNGDRSFPAPAPSLRNKLSLNIRKTDKL